MNFTEKLDSWIWIRPIPSKPPKVETHCPKSRKISKPWIESFKEWQKEQKYNFSSSSITSTGKKIKSKLSSLSDSLKMNFIFDHRHDLRKKGGGGGAGSNPIRSSSSRTLDPLYKRMDEDDDGYTFEDYLLPKSTKFVTFEDSFSKETVSDFTGVMRLDSTSNWSRFESVTSSRRTPNNLITFRPHFAMDPEPHIEDDSDPEDDPGKLLNLWLGELDNLKKGLNSPPTSPLKSSALPPVLRRRNNNSSQENSLKNQYRCSLINLDECTQDEELDAILGELSVLESQFDEEIVADQKARARDLKKDVSPVESVSSEQSSGMHSRSSSDSVEVKKESNPEMKVIKKEQITSPTSTSILKMTNLGKRTESPDNDSAFCDNVSVLSGCSVSSMHGTSPQTAEIQAALTPEQQEARLKAEKIKLAIEKIREASIKKLFIKVFTADGSAKSLLVDEKMTVGHVTRVLAEKNHVCLDPKWALVELIPDLYMDRVYEDHENLVENCLMWKMDSKNTLWFIERTEKFDVFRRPEHYLLGSSSSQRGDTMEDHSRQELVEEYFSSSGVSAPEMEGLVWLKIDNKKSWRKYYFVLRSSGLYYAPKGKKSSKDLICLATFDVNQVYFGKGWKKKYKAPTEFCFAIKHPQIQVKTPKYIRYLCVDTERELHQWVTGIRIAKNGRQLYKNYRGIEEEITHADIDILTSKRFSGVTNIPPNTLQILNVNQNGISDSNGCKSPARTPMSENKSFDSAVSSGNPSECSSTTTASLAKSYKPVEVVPESDVTPVNTLERSRTSACPSTSSSSGCMSDCCSNSSTHLSTHKHGFESDFPAGGTIKKRPSANPRLPLTNTTWGLVTSNELEDGNSSANIRVGGGGTLLRCSLRRKSSRESIDEAINASNARQQHRVMAQVHRDPAAIPSPSPAVHPAADNVDPLSEAFETSLNVVPECEADLLDDDEAPLPPPPRAESIDLGALQCQNGMTQSVISTCELDDLPPPPPPLEIMGRSNFYHAPPSLDSPPALPPPTIFKPRGQRPVGMAKKISFDDNVQLIGVSSPEYEEQEEDYEPWCPKNIVTEMPKKLEAPPGEFLQDLQRVMNKKWQVAERCRGNDQLPHQVLGFREVDMKSLVGTGFQYSRDNTVGAWVLQSQKYTSSTSPPANGVYQPRLPPQQQKQPQEPLYAICNKNFQQNKIYQSNGQQSLPTARPTLAPRPPRPPMAPPVQRPPVVLREPTPDYEVYTGFQGQRASPTSSNSDSGKSSYSNLYFRAENQMANGSTIPGHHPSFLRGSPLTSSAFKRAPPPPKRSDTTHLTTTQLS